MLNEKNKTEHRPALRIVAIYVLFAALWIYFSDTILGMLVQSPAFLVRIAVLKGLFFIFVTAILLHHLITRDIAKYKQTEQELRDSEARFSLLFENMVEGFAYCKMIFDDQDRPVDFVYLDVNSAFTKLTGLEQVKGKRVSKIIHGIREVHPELLELYGRVALTGKPETLEINFKPLKIWLSISVYSAKDRCFVAVFENITERKRSEEEREATLELLRVCNRAGDLQELMRDLVRSFQQITGCETIGFRRKAGNSFPYYEISSPLKDFTLIENTLCTSDVAQKNGEQNSADLRMLACICGSIIRGSFDASKPFFTPHGSFWTNSLSELLADGCDTGWLAAKRVQCPLFRYESLVLIPIRSQGETLALIQFNDKRKELFTEEKILLLEKLVDYVAIAVAKRKNDEQLRETTQRLQMAAASTGLGIWDWDLQANTFIWDDRMFLLYGIPNDFTPVRFETWKKTLHSGDAGRVVAETQLACRGEKNFDTEFRILQPDGTMRIIKAEGVVLRDVLGKPQRMIGINKDITRQKELEEKFIQAQKMEVVGLLAGGVAHDFNNILTAIIGYGNLLRMKLPAADPLHHYVEQILTSSEKAANLTQSLLAFSRKQVMHPILIDVNETVNSTKKLLVRVLGEDIALEVKTSDFPLMIRADTGQIEQVLLNLAANARDAMPQGGTLAITTQNTEISEQFIQEQRFGSPGRYALISITDTGVGMDRAMQQHLFEPFFTTKEVGKGPGLGLAMVYGTIKQHGGFIGVSSDLGKGTCFKIYLPLNQPGAQLHKKIQSSSIVRGTEMLLLIEDDESVRKVTKTMLEGLGYEVLEAVKGDQAIELFRENKEQVQLVISDMIMPGLTARDVHKELQSIRPDIKILFISGYTADVLERKGLEKEKTHFISKPLRPDALSKKIREVLEGRPQRRSEA